MSRSMLDLINCSYFALALGVGGGGGGAGGGKGVWFYLALEVSSKSITR
jgi:hypothetical protein